MNIWEWEFFEQFLTGGLFQVTDPGPLNFPITKFSLRRDKAFRLVLETTSHGASRSNAIQVPAGTVQIAVEQVKFENPSGYVVIANGIIPFNTQRTWARDSNTAATIETSSVHSLSWSNQTEVASFHTIDWIEGMPDSFIWPHSFEENTVTTKERSFEALGKKTVLFASSKSLGANRACAHITVGGVDLIIGRDSQNKTDQILNPGFILYKGNLSEDERSKIRDCLSFCLGTFLTHFGHTSFDEKWNPVSFHAVSTSSLDESLSKNITLPPAPLGRTYKREIDPDSLQRMMNSLFDNYDKYNFKKAFWAYWHAVAAPVHMVAAHYGAAIESLQKSFFKQSANPANAKIVSDATWSDASGKIISLISEMDAPQADKEILKNKIKSLNFAPQGIMMDRFLTQIGIRIDSIELSAWRNRNLAAHGGEIKESRYIQLIRENKVLRILMNRILLGIGRGSDFYYDYYTLGHPMMPLACPILSDQKSG